MDSSGPKTISTIYQIMGLRWKAKTLPGIYSRVWTKSSNSEQVTLGKERLELSLSIWIYVVYGHALCH